MVSIFNLDGMEHHVRTCIPKVELVPAGKPFYCLSSEDLRNTHCCYTDFCNKIDLRVPSGEWTPLLDYWRVVEVGHPAISSFSTLPPPLCWRLGEGAFWMLPEVTWEGIPANSGLSIPGEGDRLVECTTEVKAAFWVVAEEPSAAGGEWESQTETPVGGSGVILEEAAHKPCDGDGKMGRGTRAGKDGVLSWGVVDTSLHRSAT